MEPRIGWSSLGSHGRHTESLSLMRHNISHHHFIIPHAIQQRRYPVGIKQPSTFITCLDLALALSVQYYLQRIGKTFVSSCMAFGSLAKTCPWCKAMRGIFSPCPVCGGVWEFVLPVVSWSYAFLPPLYSHSPPCLSQSHVGRAGCIFHTIHNGMHNWRSWAGNSAAIKSLCKPCLACTSTFASQCS